MPMKDEWLFPNWFSCRFLKEHAMKVYGNYDSLPGHKEDRIMLQNMMGMDKNDKPIHFIALLDFIHCRKVGL